MFPADGSANMGKARPVTAGAHFKTQGAFPRALFDRIPTSLPLSR